MAAIPKSGTEMNGMGEYMIVQDEQERNRAVDSPQRTVIEHHTVFHERANHTVRNKIIGVVAAAATVAVAGGYIGNKVFNGVKEIAPTPTREFDMDAFRRAMESRSAVAQGTVESTADVETRYDFLWGEGECEFEIEGSQSFIMAPLQGGTNMYANEAAKEVTIDLAQNPVRIEDQIVSLPNPEDVCDANWIGKPFGDDADAFKTAAEFAPDELRARTEVESANDLMSMNAGEAGRRIAETAAATYDDIAEPLLQAVGSDWTIEFTYGSEEILPARQTTLTLDVDGGDINANELEEAK